MAESELRNTTESGHVFISYQWDSQETILKIADRLKTAGFKLWIDVDNMSKNKSLIYLQRNIVVMNTFIRQKAEYVKCNLKMYKTKYKTQPVIYVSRFSYVLFVLCLSHSAVYNQLFIYCLSEIMGCVFENV